MELSPVTFGGRRDESGFAAVDAMVALAILATTVVLSLAAVHNAGVIAAAAAETHRAEGELRYLLVAAPRAVGEVSGQDGGFSWRVRMEPDFGSRRGNTQICERTATARSQASGRTYALATAEMCPL